MSIELFVSILVSCFTAILSYLASRNQSKNEIAKIQVEYESKIKLLEKQREADLELIKSQGMIPVVQDIIRGDISLDRIFELQAKFPQK